MSNFPSNLQDSPYRELLPHRVGFLLNMHACCYSYFTKWDSVLPLCYSTLELHSSTRENFKIALFSAQEFYIARLVLSLVLFEAIRLYIFGQLLKHPQTNLPSSISTQRVVF